MRESGDWPRGTHARAWEEATDASSQSAARLGSISYCIVLPQSGFISPYCILDQTLIINLTSKI